MKMNGRLKLKKINSYISLIKLYSDKDFKLHFRLNSFVWFDLVVQGPAGPNYAMQRVKFQSVF